MTLLKKIVYGFVLSLNILSLSRSLGLAVAPRVRFLQKAQNSQPLVSRPNEKPAEPGTDSEEEIKSFKAQLDGRTPVEMDKEGSVPSSEGEDSSEDEEDSERLKAKDQSTFHFTNEDDEDDDCRDVEIFTVKRRDVFGVNEGEAELVSFEYFMPEFTLFLLAGLYHLPFCDFCFPKNCLLNF